MDLTPKDAELVVGLVARMGVDTKEIVSIITEQLQAFGYLVHEIHVTDSLRAFSGHFKLKSSPPEERYSSYIVACNSLRGATNSSIMATLAVGEIARYRKEDGNANDAQTRTAYIINQIKRPEEFEFFRKVYGEQYVQISCHADEEIRVGRMINLIVAGHPDDPKAFSGN